MQTNMNKESGRPGLDQISLRTSVRYTVEKENETYCGRIIRNKWTGEITTNSVWVHKRMMIIDKRIKSENSEPDTEVGQDLKEPWRTEGTLKCWLMTLEEFRKCFVDWTDLLDEVCPFFMSVHLVCCWWHGWKPACILLGRWGHLGCSAGESWFAAVLCFGLALVLLCCHSSWRR